jgi:hypothetical protein
MKSATGKRGHHENGKQTENHIVGTVGDAGCHSVGHKE